MPIPKVSVIMPVYNTAEYLNSAVESILTQTLNEIEFIIVNDGSTDESPSILRGYANLDERIILIDKENEGSSIARSAALAKATGEFLYFMDSDDILETNALEKCYAYAIENKLELIIFDALSFEDSSGLNNNDYSYNKEGLFPTRVMSGIEMISLLLERELFRVPPWIHFFKRELVVENNLNFYPGIINEDELFFSRLYFFPKRCAYLPKLFFKRRIRPNSTMTAKFSFKRASSYFIIIEELKRENVKHSAQLAKIVKKLIRNIANGLAYQSAMLPSKQRKEVISWMVSQKLLKGLKFKNLVVMFMPWTIKIKPKLRYS